MRHLVGQHCAQLNQMCILWSRVICLQRFYFCQHIWQSYDRLQGRNDADKSFQYGGTKLTSHGILRKQKSHFGHYFLHDLFHLRDRSLHYKHQNNRQHFLLSNLVKNEAESQAVFAVSYVCNVSGCAMLLDSTVIISAHGQFGL